MVWAIALALWATSAAAEVVDVKIYDAFGQSYKSVEIGESLGALYNISFDPTMVLILGPNLTDKRVQEQEDILSDIDPEEHGILFAIGTPSQTYSRGFSIAPNDAARLLPSKDAFRVLVLGPQGNLLDQSDSVIPRANLLQFAPGGG